MMGGHDKEPLGQALVGGQGDVGGRGLGRGAGPRGGGLLGGPVRKDVIGCGDGSDTIRGDAADCEIVERSDLPEPKVESMAFNCRMMGHSCPLYMQKRYLLAQALSQLYPRVVLRASSFDPAFCPA